MRLSELAGAEVVDPGGERIGWVVDVRLVQDGPVQFPYGAALRLDGLIVAERSGFRLLGYERDVRPKVFRRLVHLTAGNVRYVSYTDVELLADGRILAGMAKDECRMLEDIPRRRP